MRESTDFMQEILEPLVSVIIPNFNCERYLRRAIDSVLIQTYRNFEIFVVDNQSTDGSIEVIKSYGSRVRLLSCSDKGAGPTRNLGIEHSNGKFIAFLDSDDYWVEDKLEKQLNVLLSDPSCGIVYCGAFVAKDHTDLNYQSNLLGIEYPEYEGNVSQIFHFKPTKGIVLLGCSSAVIRRDVLVRSGYFDRSFKGAAEDWDFFRRVCRETTLRFCKEPLFVYTRNANSVSARPIHDFILGNCRAVLKMRRDEEFSHSKSLYIFVLLTSVIVKSTLKRLMLRLFRLGHQKF